MSDVVEIIQEADLALMEIEQARVAMEGAKITFEIAKNDHDRAKAAFDEVIARADELGVPRAKLRRLAEERAAALLASGIMSVPVNQLKAERARKAKKAKLKAEGKGKGKNAAETGAEGQAARLDS